MNLSICRLPPTLLLLLMSFSPVGWSSTSTTVVPPWEGLQPLGEGRFSRWLFDIYDARLYAATSRWPGEVRQALPLALELTYLRTIPAKALLAATAEQWQELPAWANEPRCQQWLDELHQLWPDVNPGDRLAAVVDAQGQTHFYFNDSPLGTVVDPLFGKAFLDIWLSPNTSAPGLRAQLIGEQP